MMNVPIGRPWEMLAVDDILQVPMSMQGNQYLLVLEGIKGEMVV